MKLKLKNSIKIAQIMGTLLIAASAFAVETDPDPAVIRGVLQYTDHFSIRFNHGGIFEEPTIVAPENVLNEMKSLVGKTPFVEVRGTLSQDGKSIQTSEVPTQVYGDQEMAGIFKADGRGGYMIDDKPVEFGKTAIVTKATFNQDSRNFFLNKYVRAEGTPNAQNIFVIQSIIDAGVFSAEPITSQRPKKFLKNPFKEVQEIVDGTEKPNPHQSFRVTLFAKSSGVMAGEPVMILTASGREGDSAGAVNGHFAVGRGQVDIYHNIQGDMFNVYVTNEKQIVPGDVNVVDYYGHLISGQSNYRPTYTLLVYGISREQMDKVRDELDKFHPFFRGGKTKITSNTNCATLSVQALADIGIYGTPRNGKNGTKDFPLLSSRTQLPPKLSFAQTLEYVLRTPRSEFVPGPALVSILENLKHINKAENLGITRIDFVFGAQTPSDRQVGGAPTTGVISDLTKEIEIGGTVEAEDINGDMIKAIKKAL